jgi:hypothetical protein
LTSTSNPTKVLVDTQLSGPDGTLKLSFRINRQGLAQARALSGRYALVSNADHLDADQALGLFKGQDGVEKRFGTVKGPLLVHPLFVRTDRRIEGLIFITLLGLLVRAVLERACLKGGLKLTADGLFQGFDSLQAVDVIWADGRLERRATETSAFQEEVLGALGWSTPEAYTRLSSHDALTPT